MSSFFVVLFKAADFKVKFILPQRSVKHGLECIEVVTGLEKEKILERIEIENVWRISALMGSDFMSSI